MEDEIASEPGRKPNDTQIFVVHKCPDFDALCSMSRNPSHLAPGKLQNVRPVLSDMS